MLPGLTSLSFSCNISELGIINMRHGSILFWITGSEWWWWFNDLEDILLAHFEPLSTKWAFDHVRPFVTTEYPSSDGCFPHAALQNSNHLKLFFWTSSNMIVSSFYWNDLCSHQISIQMGGMGQLHHWLAAKMCSNYVVLSYHSVFAFL